ncbi:MAG TPA: hypothetical protein DCR47_06540 [Cryomorphaceae bacterium]|jgi:hypothetical protein|nr:hypothetical protein [Cryomorphaceae bacterium]
MKYLLFVLVTLTAFNAIGEEKEMVLKVKNGVIVSEYNSTQNLDLILVQTETFGNHRFRKKALAMLEMAVGAYIGIGGVAGIAFAIDERDWLGSENALFLAGGSVGAAGLGTLIFCDGRRRWKKGDGRF